MFFTVVAELFGIERHSSNSACSPLPPEWESDPTHSFQTNTTSQTPWTIIPTSSYQSLHSLKIVFILYTSTTNFQPDSNRSGFHQSLWKTAQEKNNHCEPPRNHLEEQALETSSLPPPGKWVGGRSHLLQYILPPITIVWTDSTVNS